MCFLFVYVNICIYKHVISGIRSILLHHGCMQTDYFLKGLHGFVL